MKMSSTKYRLCGTIDKYSVMGLTGAFWAGMIDMSDLESIHDISDGLFR